MEYLDWFEAVKKNWDRIAKPLDSLGELENVVCRIGAIQETDRPHVKNAVAVILCADNGIVEEGVSQCGKEVTRICAENIAAKKSAVGSLARLTGTEIKVFDIGIEYQKKITGVSDRKISMGAKNFLKEDALSNRQLDEAIKTGIEIAGEMKAAGYDAICIGEMGIGNTTTSAAVTAGILKLGAADVTGRGAGLDDRGLERKIKVVSRAIDRYDLHNLNPVEILQKVGGLDIAAMTGVYLGAKKFHIPVILDGAISLAALLVADFMDSDVRKYVIASHKGREILGQKILEKMDLHPVIDASLALGEGTGAVLMMNLIRSSLDVYYECVPFSDSGVEQYERFNK